VSEETGVKLEPKGRAWMTLHLSTASATA